MNYSVVIFLRPTFSKILFEEIYDEYYNTVIKDEIDKKWFEFIYEEKSRKKIATNERTTQTHTLTIIQLNR